jgi:AcrR family transcriptional regulator
VSSTSSTTATDAVSDLRDTRSRIEDALIELIADGDRLNHDGVAERAGVSRRTLYRYFPDRDALMRAVAEKVRSLAGPNVRFPQSEEELLSTLRPIYEGLEAIAPIATVVRSTPQGRAARLADKQRRVRAYTAAAADAVSQLPLHDRRLATAMLQFLHSSAWLELRDQWGMSGAEIAEACGWAMRTLLADLRQRGSKPLSEGPAS